MLEIEQKFVVSSPEKLVESLLSVGADHEFTIWQKDEYFNHPSREFGESDEAFRIRYEGSVRPTELGEQLDSQSDGGWHVTYKGPKEPGTVKIREEIELPLCQKPADYQSWKTILEKLSFRYVASVEKQRENWTWSDSSDGSVVITIDRVTDLGTFAEIEVVTSRDQVSQAEQRIWEVAQKLGLDQPTRKSYLRQILKLNNSQ